MASGYWSPLAIGVNDGPTITTAASLTALPTSAKYTFPPNGIQTGTLLRVRAMGRISVVVTSPGTSRFDLRLGGTVIFDSGALTLETTAARTTVPWWLDIECICRQGGTAGNFFGFVNFTSSVVIGSVTPTTGGNGSLVSAVSGGAATAPAVGGNVDLTTSNVFDFFYTQTVGTAGTSFTVHNFCLESAAVALT